MKCVLCGWEISNGPYGQPKDVSFAMGCYEPIHVHCQPAWGLMLEAVEIVKKAKQ